MNKKAQFFIITALIIAGITIGFGTLYNTAKIQEKEDIKVYEFSEELKSEIQQAYDSGILGEKPAEQIKEDLESLARHYAYENPDSNFLVVYGDETDLRALYNRDGTITTSSITGQEPDASIRPSREENRVRICMNFEGSSENQLTGSQESEESPDCNIVREFTLKKGQTFYVVVRKKVKNEEIIIAG